MHKKTTLDTGLRLVTESIPNARTTALGIWVDVGSRDEIALNNGTSHFLEHLFFKGTAQRTAHQISLELDRYGGMS
ncbi:MAG: insulinase family protein, partial [Spirochaetales bacterium]|nr:insulinase family protein [Spirochaetales bacterium]